MQWFAQGRMSLNLMEETMSHATRFKILVAAILLASASAILFARKSAAQEEKPPSLPVPEMQRLSKLYVGKWEYTETYPKSPFTRRGPWANLKASWS
jgi:hypothetical protein